MIFFKWLTVTILTNAPSIYFTTRYWESQVSGEPGITGCSPVVVNLNLPLGVCGLATVHAYSLIITRKVFFFFLHAKFLRLVSTVKLL